MREIEFRGKDSENNWLYGSLNRFTNDDDYIQYEDGDDMVGSAVDKETVGQYIGLQDKNDKKIFEGDIIKTYHGLGKVVFSKKFALFGYIMLDRENKETEYDYRFTDIAMEEGIEVIGNIYDNPELLEAEDGEV